MSESSDVRVGEDVELSGDGIRAYLALPPGGRGPGVVVLQEWWGLVDHIRDVCDRLAREGFTAMAPDLYRGESTADPGEAGRMMQDLEIPRARADMDLAVQALLGHSSVDGPKLGCIGFCMGGQLALAAGASNRRIGAIVDCYGIHPNVTVDFSGLEAAVFGVFAENDEFVAPSRARDLEDEIRGAQGRVRCKVYPGVQHAFLNDSRPDVYDAVAAAEAWNDILSFLRSEL